MNDISNIFHPILQNQNFNGKNDAFQWFSEKKNGQLISQNKIKN